MTVANLPIPSEFLYWQNRDKPFAKALQDRMAKLYGFRPTLPDEVVRQFAAMYYDADPVAEAFVEEVYLTQGQARGRQILDRALASGVNSVPDAPDSLHRLFQEVEQDPDWLDWALVDKGAKCFRRFGTRLYSMAGAITLHGYQENSVSKPLAMTGAYNGESAQRRFLETARFWIDVSEPNGLRPGGQGRKTAMLVRIMHVFVRKRLLKHPDWQLDAWGVPISQGDALLTLMGGSIAPGFLMRLLGYRVSDDDILALLHFWRYIGHLVGVQPRWYPQTIADAAGLMFAAEVKGARQGGDDARQLAQSYLASYLPRADASGWHKLQQAWDYRMQLGYVGLFLAPRTHARYQLPPAGPWRVLPFLQVPVNYLADTLRQHSTSVDRLVDWQARRATQRWVQSRLGKRQAEFRAVEQFTR